jgi:hypothetical protein
LDGARPALRIDVDARDAEIRELGTERGVGDAEAREHAVAVLRHLRLQIVEERRHPSLQELPHPRFVGRLSEDVGLHEALEEDPADRLVRARVGVLLEEERLREPCGVAREQRGRRVLLLQIGADHRRVRDDDLPVAEDRDLAHRVEREQLRGLGDRHEVLDLVGDPLLLEHDPHLADEGGLAGAVDLHGSSSGGRPALTRTTIERRRERHCVRRRPRGNPGLGSGAGWIRGPGRAIVRGVEGGS